MANEKLTFLTVLLICAFSITVGQKYVAELNENTWHEMLQDEWMVAFYAPWCPACQGLHNVWKDFSTVPNLKVKVGQVDVTNSPGLSGRFMVTALPTIFHVLNGEFRQYKGTRDKTALISFIREKKWQTVDPVPSWKSPNTLQMSVVSSFFKLSQILRTVHNHFMEEFGMPTWGSYLIFAIGTIILGALLGLVLVCVIDLVYPPKPFTSFKASGNKKKDSDSEINSEDELAEDIKDDLYDDAQIASNNKEEGTKSDNENTEAPSSPSVHKRKPRKAD